MFPARTLFCVILIGCWFGWLIPAGLAASTNLQPANIEPARVESDFVIRTWTTENGLPMDAVRALAQTPDGYLWVGTFGGLARFDGRDFQIFHVGNTPELPDNLINALFCDRRGRLWIGHDSGQITVMEGRTFRRIRMPDDWLRIPIRDFGDNADGDVWVLNGTWQLGHIATAGKLSSVPIDSKLGQLLHFDSSAPDGRLRAIALDGRCYVAGVAGLEMDADTPPAGLGGWRVIVAAAGGYWGVQDQQLCRWQAGKVVEGLGRVAWGKPIFATTCEWNGMVAAGTFSEGLSLAGQDGRRIRFDSKSGLPSDWVRALLADRGGALWVGTGDGGLAAIWPKRVRVIAPPDDAARKHIQSVTAGRSGEIWVATEGAGLFQVNGDVWARAPDFPGDQLTVYSSILMDGAGRLWSAASSGGVDYLQSGKWHRVMSGIRIAGARSALYSEADALYVTLWKDLVRLSGVDFATEEGLPDCDGVCCIADDGEGGIWFGGYGIGLGRWNQNQNLKARLGAKEGLPSNNILALKRTADGTLWIGSDGDGLIRMKAGRFSVISTRHGLPSATICQIIEDDQGRLWMGTYRGICAVSLAELNACAEGSVAEVKCLVLDTTDGLESRACSAGNQPAVCRTDDGRLWFATQRGVAVVSPDSIAMNNRPPSVWIERLKTDAGDVKVGGSGASIELPLGQRRLQIGFNAPSLLAAHRVRFRHRLEPVESDWIDSGESREVVYAQMLPGKYTFRVIACNEDGVWNTTGASIAFIVPPYLWERGWFAPVVWILSLGLVAAIVAGFIRQRLKRRMVLLEQQRVVDRERSRIAHDLHDDLGGSLTEISMLAEGLNRVAAADANAQQSVSLIRRESTRVVRALDEIVWAVNPKHDSVTSLADYLSGFAQEFLDAAGVRLWLDVTRDLPESHLHPECRHNLFLSVKETLNNVVRHSGATEVWLRIFWSSGSLKIIVEDNGHGLNVKNTPTTGDGLGNLQERLLAHQGVCRITPRAGGGLRVELEMPLK